jgi:hypothetical protein
MVGFLNQLQRSPQLRRTAVKIGGGRSNVSVSDQRFENVYDRFLVGQGCQECSAPAMTAGSCKPRTGIQRGERLSQAVGATSLRFSGG